MDSAAQPSTDPCPVLRPDRIEAFDRGNGVRTLPFDVTRTVTVTGETFEHP